MGRMGRMGRMEVTATFIKSGLPRWNFAAEEDGPGGLLRQGCEGQGAGDDRRLRMGRMGRMEVTATFIKSGLPRWNFAAEEDGPGGAGDDRGLMIGRMGPMGPIKVWIVWGGGMAGQGLLVFCDKILE